jgi:membrane protease YdiL (CAAX protease family)
MTAKAWKHEGGTAHFAYIGQLILVVALTWAAVASMSVSEAVTSDWLAKLYISARMAVLVLLCSYFVWRGGESWADLGLRKPPSWWRVVLPVVIGFALIIAVSLLVYRGIMPALSVEQPTLPRTISWSEDPLEYFYWAFLVAWGSAAFGEEMLARGFILDRIQKLIGSDRSYAAGLAVIGQAVLFGSFHLYQGLGGAILTCLTGLVLGLSWLWGGRNLWPAIILHGLVNFLSYSGL